MAESHEYAVSIKKSDWKRAKLLGSGGQIVSLKIYAVRFASLERAEQVARDVMGTNIGVKAVAIRI